jgi:hypothetical protein
MDQFKFTTLILMFIVTVLAVLNTTPMNAAGFPVILSHSSFIDDIGYFHVVGEVKNAGDVSINSVKVTAIFYDADNTVLAQNFAYSLIDLILPGRKAPFEIMLMDKAASSKVDHYTLDIDFNEFPSGKPIGLKILSNNSYIDQTSFLHVTGGIENIADTTATNIRVVATFYDQQGNVVGCAYAYAEPKDLDPNQNASFDITLMYPSRTPYVKSYQLTAESSEYTLIPEFGTPMLYLVFLATILFVVILKRQL